MAKSTFFTGQPVIGASEGVPGDVRLSQGRHDAQGEDCFVC